MQSNPETGDLYTKKVHEDALYECVRRCEKYSKGTIEHMKKQYHKRFKEERDNSAHLVSENDRLTAECASRKSGHRRNGAGE